MTRAATLTDQADLIVCPSWCHTDHQAELTDEISSATATHQLLDAHHETLRATLGGMVWQPSDPVTIEYTPLHARTVGSVRVDLVGEPPTGDVTVRLTQLDDELPGIAVDTPARWTEEYTTTQAVEVAELLVRAAAALTTDRHTATAADELLLGRYARDLRAQGYAAATVRAKVDVPALIARALGAPLLGLTRHHLLEYFDQDLAPWTRRKYLEHVRAFARWADMDDPTAGLRAPRQPRGKPKPVSEEHLAELLAASPVGSRVRAFVVLGAYAGLRSFEIAKVRADDLQRTPRGGMLAVHGKGDRRDTVPAPAVVLEALAPFLAAAVDGGALWPGVSANAVQCAIRKAGRRLGFAVSAHQLRHRFGTMIYGVSRDLLLTQRLMRHDSPTTTAGYTLSTDDGAHLVDQLPTY